MIVIVSSPTPFGDHVKTHYIISKKFPIFLIDSPYICYSFVIENTRFSQNFVMFIVSNII